MNKYHTKRGGKDLIGGRIKEDYDNQWAFNSVENKELKRINNQLTDIEDYLYANEDKIPKKVYDDILKILWRRK